MKCAGPLDVTTLFGLASLCRVTLIGSMPTKNFVFPRDIISLLS
jgi:hypothetical protein